MLNSEKLTVWCDAALKALSAPHAEASVEDGQLWFAAPLDTPAQILHSFRDDPKAKPPELVNERFEVVEPSSSRIEGTVWLKVSIHSDPPKLHLRPGLVFARGHAPGRAVLVPGFSKPGKPHLVEGMPRIEIEYPPRSKYPRGYFHFWLPWGASSRPGESLIEPFTDLKTCGALSARNYDHEARRLMAETLGLTDAPTWGPPTKDEIDRLRKRAQFRRGEVVALRVSPERPEIPAVVVSDDLLNGSNRNRIVVLQTVDYVDGDEDDDGFVPIDVPGFGRRSVAMSAVRGLSNAKRSTRSLRVRRLLTDRHLSGAWHKITTRLRVMYG